MIVICGLLWGRNFPQCLIPSCGNTVGRHRGSLFILLSGSGTGTLGYGGRLRAKMMSLPVCNYVNRLHYLILITGLKKTLQQAALIVLEK